MGELLRLGPGDSELILFSQQSNSNDRINNNSNSILYATDDNNNNNNNKFVWSSALSVASFLISLLY